MIRELPPFTSLFQKSEGSPSDVPPTKDKVDWDNLPPEVKGRVPDPLSYEQGAVFDPKWNSTSGQKGKLPPNCDPDHEGLVCMNISKSPHEERLIVFNSLTAQWKELPPLLHRRNPVLMHMYADQSSKSYHILAAGSSASGEESLSRITELYDSRTGQWERVGDLPGPAFALNEYQSGVFQNGNIFCIGFLELGDQTVKGILGYNVEEGLWSTKWTAEALPNSTILQLVENNGDLFLFSERDNGPLIEHWVDRIEWTQSEGDNENTTLKLVNVLKEEKSGGRSLEEYPQFALVPFSESQLCIFNTVEHSGEVYYIGAPSFENLPSNPGRSFGCSTLRLGGFLSCLHVVGASPASAPGSSTSQISSTYPPVWYYVGVAATIIGTAIGVISLGVSLYYNMRERRDSVRGVLDVLTRPFRQRQRGMCILVGNLKVGEASLDDLRLEFPV